MRKIIWSCWFEGREAAPEIVRECLRSWEDTNPGWELRCLDADTVGRYINIDDYVDLSSEDLTADSLSGLLSLLLLHEYGGVWVDATTFCTAPLDDWLEQAVHGGFFAPASADPNIELESWFLAAKPGNSLVAKWAARAVAYWRGRRATRDPFWLHHQFGELIAIDPSAFAEWQAVPRVGVDGLREFQSDELYVDYETGRDRVDWAAPLFKLTPDVDHKKLWPTSLLVRLVDLKGEETTPTSPEPKTTPPQNIAYLRMGTQNVGDHIQVIAGQKMLARAGLAPSAYVDRDNEIANPPPGGESTVTGILLNGWFKFNSAQWPPHPSYSPLYLSFHIRQFYAPSLVSPEAISHYKTHGPIGCRDRYTQSVLRAHGVDAFLSHCLTTTFPRRLPDPDQQTEVFVVSRDQRILDYLPANLGPYTFISQYTDTIDFAQNLATAQDLLDTYRTRARLIITTMLHCALPAIAMGIPVVVLYPPNDEVDPQSDKQRLSSLADIVRVFELSQASVIDWRGYTPDVGDIKLGLIDAFFLMASKWGALATPRLEGIAPGSVDQNSGYSYFDDPERLERLASAQAPDRQKWGVASSYRPEWAARGQLAARHIADGERIFEIGVGSGTFRALVADRCRYTGADLQPIDSQTLTLNLERDPLPAGPWDTVVLLGVLEYIHAPAVALAKVFADAGKVVMSYCVPRAGDVMPVRQSRGWVNALSEGELIGLARAFGFEVIAVDPFNFADDFDQKVFLFVRASQR